MQGLKCSGESKIEEMEPNVVMGFVTFFVVALCRAIANFSVTFSVISVLTGLTTMYNTGLTYGGPLTMVYGWPIVGVLTLIVGLSMAEICSAFPTSGGLYFWSAKLSGSDWGPFASWITGWYGLFPILLYNCILCHTW